MSRIAHKINQMKMTAVVIKFSNSVFLVKIYYLQKTAVFHLKEKNNNKNPFVLFNGKFAEKAPFLSGLCSYSKLLLLLLVPDQSLLFLFPHEFFSGICACEDLCSTIYKKGQKIYSNRGEKRDDLYFYFDR